VDDALEKMAGGEHPAAAIGTPDDLVKAIKHMLAISGGVGAVMGFVHDWANPENTRRSWDMVARYVIPEINGFLEPLRQSRQFLVENRAVFERAGQAVMAKIMANDKAAAALAQTGPGRLAINSPNAPDLQKEAEKLRKA
jgi:limonene 1,2-monooxygenase